MQTGNLKPAKPRQRVPTSCLECQRRKQKCNKEVPCRNCARRYPPVDCVYQQARANNSSEDQRSANFSEHQNSLDTIGDVQVQSDSGAAIYIANVEQAAEYPQYSTNYYEEGYEDSFHQDFSGGQGEVSSGANILYGAPQPIGFAGQSSSSEPSVDVLAPAAPSESLQDSQGLTFNQYSDPSRNYSSQDGVLHVNSSTGYYAQFDQDAPRDVLYHPNTAYVPDTNYGQAPQAPQTPPKDGLPVVGSW